MKRIGSWIPAIFGLFILFAGCRQRQEAAPSGPSPKPVAAQPADPSATEALSSAREALKANKVDEAAAKLAQVQMSGASFNTEQAKDYRKAMSEAYEKAMEAAQRGDPKGQAALQLLRAAGPGQSRP